MDCPNLTVDSDESRTAATLTPPPFVSVAATRITALAVICPVLTGYPFYSCYAGLMFKLTREGKSPGDLCLLAKKTRIWADKLVSMNDRLKNCRHAYPLWLSSRRPFSAFS